MLKLQNAHHPPKIIPQIIRDLYKVWRIEPSAKISSNYRDLYKVWGIEPSAKIPPLIICILKVVDLSLEF